MHQIAKHLSFIFLLLLSVSGYAADRGGQGAIGGSCARCHGADGNSSGGQYPSLAKQKMEYLVKQMHDFKSGARVNAQMTPLIAVLTDEEINAIAKFYSEENITKQRGIDEDLAKMGEDIAKTRGCAACHQANYRGAGVIPRLSRQKRIYLVKSMTDFRDGNRTNDNGIKTEIMKTLSDEEIKSLSHFLAGM
jgi:cytochrome c553